MPAWTAEEERELSRWTDKDVTAHEIAKHFNDKFKSDRSESSIRCKIKYLRAGRTPHAASEKPAAVPVQEFEQAANQAEIARLKKELEAQKKTAQSAAGVEAAWDDEWNGPEEWAKAARDASKRIEKAKNQGRFSVKFDKPIAIAAISDQHIAPGTPVDFDRMKEDAELVAQTEGFYAILGGDGIDGHIKHRAAVLAARSQPDDQYRLFDFYLSIFAPKILCMITGNHEWWTNQIGGIDMVARLAADNRICYGGHEARLAVSVAGADYEIMIRHQANCNSMFNQTHAVKRYYDTGSAPFDIGVIGHHHEHACESFVKHGQIRWACRPGSYQITSAYARQYGFADAIPTCPTFILLPGRREIVGFSDLRHAVRAYKSFV